MSNNPFTNNNTNNGQNYTRPAPPQIHIPQIEISTETHTEHADPPPAYSEIDPNTSTTTPTTSNSYDRPPPQSPQLLTPVSPALPQRPTSPRLPPRPVSPRLPPRPNNSAGFPGSVGATYNNVNGEQRPPLPVRRY